MLPWSQGAGSCPAREGEAGSLDGMEATVGRGKAKRFPLRVDFALVETPEGYPVWIEEEVLVSHGAMIHGAGVKSGALAGMEAMVLEGSAVSGGSIVGTGSVVPSGHQIAPNSAVLGITGKIVRETTHKARQFVFNRLEEAYQKSR